MTFNYPISANSINLNLVLSSNTDFIENACLASLGNNTKFQAIVSDTEKKHKRRQLFNKQSRVKKYLLGIKNRISSCLSAPISNTSSVAICSNADQNCKYKGLQLCGSRWACPICSNKLNEASRQEILKASNKHLSNGGGFALMTTTVPHYLCDNLDKLIDLSTQARDKFNGMYAVKKIFKKLGRIGYIRSSEIKHGKNGWHPHQHFLFYLKSILTKELRAEIEKDLLKCWQKSCVKVGLPMPNHHGLDFLSCTDPLKSSDYIIKDTFEIASSNTKGSKKDSINPFDLLLDEPYKYGNRQKLFIEYYHATKGKSLISWSKGLKKLFQVAEKSDEQILNDELEQYDIPVVIMPKEDWSIIKKSDLRVELLEFTEKYLKSNHLISIIDYEQYMYDFFEGHKMESLELKKDKDGNIEQKELYNSPDSDSFSEEEQKIVNQFFDDAKKLDEDYKKFNFLYIK